VHVALDGQAVLSERGRQIVSRLQVQPELGRRTEIAGEADCGIRRDRARPLYAKNVADPGCRNAQRERESVRRQAERLHELLAEYLAGMATDARHLPLPSVVIDYLDQLGAALAPDKANAPLIVDPHAMLALAAALKRFEAIARRRSQVREPACCIEHVELAVRHLLDCLKYDHGFAPEQRLGPSVLERPDHGLQV